MTNKEKLRRFLNNPTKENAAAVKKAYPRPISKAEVRKTLDTFKKGY